jgi:hypothetical protein
MEIFADPELWKLIGLFVVYSLLSLFWFGCAACINLNEEGFSFPKWTWKQKILLVLDLLFAFTSAGVAIFYFVIATAYLGSLL